MQHHPDRTRNERPRRHSTRATLLILGLFASLLASHTGAAQSPDPAFAEGAFDDGNARVEARLLLHPDDDPAKGPVRVGVLFRLDPGWHLYWRNPGDTGLPTRLHFTGGEAGPLRWPAPSAFVEDQSLVTYGYEDHVLLATELVLPPQRAAERRIGVEADVLVCSGSCIPASFALERRLDARDREEVARQVRRLFAEQEAALPLRPAAFGVEATASKITEPDAAGAVEAELVVRPCDQGRRAAACSALAPAPSEPGFFPDAGSEGAPRVLEVSTIEGGGGLRVRLAFESATGSPDRVRGVLALRDANGRPRHLEIDVPVTADAGGGAGLAVALGLGLLGGLLLNLMPCVLPVLALKVFAVVELAGASRRHAFSHGLAYTAGILGSMGVLALVVLALRLTGSQVGWGFQFQEPAFVVAVCVVVVLFALNLFGVFEIGFVPSSAASLGADARGARRSFFEGLLAVVLATPCSAPFLGTAVGFAFAGGTLPVLATFFAIGCGLAAPFLLISAFPPWARWLPRPGAWMAQLRAGLGFALLATAVWLVWVLGRSAGVDAVAGLLALLVAVSLGAWAIPRLEARVARGIAVAGGAVLILASANLVSVREEPQATATREAPEAEWSAEGLARLHDAGRPVLVVFTADWCLTCKVNEKTVLRSEAVREALHRGGFTVLRADWTHRDEAIRRELARFGKAGVPLYLVYRPGVAEPEVLPELLSQERLLVAIDGGETDHAQTAGDADAS